MTMRTRSCCTNFKKFFLCLTCKSRVMSPVQAGTCPGSKTAPSPHRACMLRFLCLLEVLSGDSYEEEPPPEMAEFLRGFTISGWLSLAANVKNPPSSSVRFLGCPPPLLLCLSSSKVISWLLCT